MPADLVAADAVDPHATEAENRERFRRERELRDATRRAIEDAFEREVERIEASGERVGWIFGVPTDATIVMLLRDD